MKKKLIPKHQKAGKILINEIEKKLLSVRPETKEKLANLTEIEKRIIYRKCFLTKEQKEEYEIENIKFSYAETLLLKVLYFECFATFPEIEAQKDKELKTQTFKDEEIELMYHLNTFLSKANWQEDKIKDIAKNFNTSIKDLAIKYRYIALLQKDNNTNNFHKFVLTDFVKSQIFSYDEKEILNINIYMYIMNQLN